jgi:hypothetical protein
MFLAAVALALSRPLRLPRGVEPFEPLALLEDAPFLVFSGLGALVASRRPKNPIGWMFAAIGFFLLLSLFATEYALYALHTNPGSLPGGAFMAWASTWPWLIGLGVVALVILLFPNGRLVSRRWRPLAWLVVADTALMAIPAAVLLWPDRGLEMVTNLEDATVSPVVERIVVIAYPVLLVALLPVAASMLLRFRRARGDERQQLKWVAYGVGVLLGTVVFSEAEELVGVSLGSTFSRVVDALGLLAVPIAAGIAILRYRLYDIDLIINRTLVYVVLTTLLALVYVGGVVGVGGLVREATGEQSNDLVIAASTLAVAALFRPARARVQGFIDRRFYRRKYDAARTLEAFAASIREQVTLEAVTADLQSVVRNTMQPSHVSMWLRG